MVRSLARWLMAAAGSVLLGLALIGAGLYWHFLRSGPAPAPWHEVALADFTAAQAGTVRTLDDYQVLEERLFADLQHRGSMAPSHLPTGSSSTASAPAAAAIRGCGPSTGIARFAWSRRPACRRAAPRCCSTA